MSTNKRASLPGASELFAARGTKSSQQAAAKTPAADTGLSGRVKHDHKISVYCSAEDMLAIDSGLLEARRALGRNLDRGRFIRAAISLALEDLEANHEQSKIIQVLNDD